MAFKADKTCPRQDTSRRVPPIHPGAKLPMSREDVERGARFEQAKKPAQGSQFLQIVAKPKRGARGEKPEQKLTRVAFKVCD
jgi:hypothetical protein